MLGGGVGVMVTHRHRHASVSLFGGKEGDVSKCPFFGGPNGGGVGDANIVTACIFVAFVLILRLLLLKAIDCVTSGNPAAYFMRPMRRVVMSVLAFSHFAAQSSALAPAYVAPLVRVPVGGSVMMAPADSLSSNFICSGRLCFGADWGPRQVEHGQWQPGYWVVLDDDDKSEVSVALNQIGPGLQAGDGCLVELDRMKGTLQLKAGPLVELEERSHAAVRRLQAAMKPLGTMAVIVAVAAILASRSPPPTTGQERMERCERLISGAVEVHSYNGAQGWLKHCGLSSGEQGAQLLLETWAARWGEQPSGRMVDSRLGE